LYNGVRRSPKDKKVLHRTVLAHSVQGREIEGIFFSASSEVARLDTLFLGAFHGDEGISTALLKRLIEVWNVGHWQSQGPLDFEKTPVLFVPALNPDGLAAETRINANGVDLNRNYPTEEIGAWEILNQGTPYYSGPAPASEPETRLVIELLARFQPRKIISVHSPYKVLNFDGPARHLAEVMSTACGYPVVEDIGYPTPGSFGTYAGKIRQIPVITLELPEDESLEQVWTDNAEALEIAVRFQESA
jgi:protein MpaA